MSKRSLAQAPAHPKPPATPLELYAEAVERELARLYELRPNLHDRLGRAASLLVTHLSSPPRQRPIKCRIRHDGRRVLLVRSLTANIAYEVSPESWSCSCPDFRRRGGQACKHGLAGWLIHRASLSHEEAPREAAGEDEGGGDEGCSACEGGWVYLGTEVVNPQTGEIAEAINPVRCTRCGDGLTHDEVQRWLESQRWHFAKSMPDNPHSYCLRREAGDERTFEAVVQFIRVYGSAYPWWGRQYDQLPLGEHCYWTMGAPIPETVLINRKTLERVRIDQLTNKGGGGIVWPWLHQDIEAEREELRRQEAGQDELGGAS